MFDRSIHDFLIQPTNTLHFFDRGLTDLHSYQSQYFDNIQPSLLKAINKYRYNTKVFLFPAWEDIYCHDTERKLSFAEAVKTFHSVKQSYAICGYQTIEVPKASVQERVAF